MKYRVEIGNADDVERYDETLDSPHWESVASGETAEEALEFLLRNANSEEFEISNSWLRLVIDDKEVITY